MLLTIDEGYEGTAPALMPIVHQLIYQTYAQSQPRLPVDHWTDKLTD